MNQDSKGGRRLAVDIGGTFTDVVLEKDGRYHGTKVLTTHQAPAEGFMLGVERVLAETNTDAAHIELIIHGTTLATNALIERKGARTALITTEGHRDALEMAYENRFDQYDIQADRLPPLVPRELRVPVPERVNYRGKVIRALDEGAVRAVIAELQSAGVESVAVGLLHAYANPDHEQRVGRMLAELAPELMVSLASDVCPEIREYERQSTTCANAYVRPLISGYLEDLQHRLRSASLESPCMLMTSGGNLITIETAKQHPIRLVESGPAGGAVLAAHIARELGEDSVVSFDMGGTTAKICLIDDGEPLLSRQFEVGRAHRFMKGSGMPIKIPVVEMVEIGAGGGSIASVDRLGRIQVGPQSAGSEPGPACYGQGGERAAITDANLLLGRLDPDEFAEGRMVLDAAAAQTVIEQDIAGPTGLGLLDAAKGIIEIVDENMAAAARVHAVERGKEIAARTMIAFGGGAPLHAARLAEKLSIDCIIIPGNAGVGSAIGFLLAPIAYEVVRSRYLRLSVLDPEGLRALFDEMRAEAAAVVSLGAGDASLDEKRHGYARYVGQGHEIKIELPAGEFNDGLADELRQAFETEYQNQYDRTVPGLDIEVLTWSVILSAPVEAPQSSAFVDAGGDVVKPVDKHRRLHAPGASESVEAVVIDRQLIQPGGEVLSGPVVITEPQTTSIVPPGFDVSVNRRGDLVLVRVSSERDVAATAAAIRNQVIWDRLTAIVEEQAQALIRTAFSTTVREAGDLSAGVFDLRGRMLAQAVTGTPGHVNAMAASVGFFTDKIPLDRMRPGDVYVTNDPWHGTGHLFDFTVVTPVFKDGAPVAMFASTVHVVDIGGPGFGPDAGQVYEEGLCIPILPLFEAGEPNNSVLEIVRANVREPVQVVGDLYSLTTSNAVGGRRLLEMMDEFGLNALEGIGDHIIETSNSAMLEEIRKLPFGRYENDMEVDGHESPVLIKATMDIGEDGIDVDLDGTSGMSPYGINVPITYTQAYASFGIRCVVGNDIPNNTGSLAPIRITAPEGCIMNAPRPAAVTVRHVLGQMLPDVVLGCLEKAKPGVAPAEGSSSLWNPMLSGGHGIVGDHDYGDSEPFSVTIFHSGGTGARPGKAGLSATAFPSGVRNTPVEITESISPMVFKRKEYRVGSGGEGNYSGGDGQIIEVEHGDGAPFAVFALFDRIDHPARGRHGGGDGAPGCISRSDGVALRGKGKQVIPAGVSLILELPGGGALN